MGRKFTPGRLLPVHSSRRREPRAQAPGIRNDAQSARFEAFCTQTFPYVEAVYADALCLTGNPEAAADLVEAAFVRAFLCYEQFRRRRNLERLRTRSTLAWLYGNMHSVFCDTVLARQYVTPDGD